MPPDFLRAAAHATSGVPLKRLHDLKTATPHLLVVMAVLLAPAIAAAQATAYPRTTPQPALHAADPLAQVPATAYQSTLNGLAQGVESQSADWRRANDEVGQFKRGHIDLLKLENGSAAQPDSLPAPPRSRP